MSDFVVKANIDHYLDLLDNHNIAHETRSIVTKLLIFEEDKLSYDLEQLEFAESRAASGRERVSHVRRIRDALTVGTAEHSQAEALLINFENRQTLLEDLCHRLRNSAKQRSI